VGVLLPVLGWHTRLEERRRVTEVIGPVETMTKSEAERKKLEFMVNLKVNSNEYRIPSSRTFAHAVQHYRESMTLISKPERFAWMSQPIKGVRYRAA